MQKSTPMGLIAGFGLIFGTILMGDGWTTFIDPASLTIVVGGMMAALFVAFSADEMKTVPGLLQAFLRFQPPVLSERVTELAELARVARREGLLALDRRLGAIDDDLLRFGLEMAVDGVEPDEIDELMRAQIAEGAQRRKLLARVMDTGGTYAPAFGMIGTLIGLIQMLQNLNDPSAIGPAMAVAMITTFYGALLANLVCLPIATKAKEQSREIVKAEELTRAGVLGIVRGESPAMLEKRLNLFVEDAPAAAKEVTEPTLARAA